MDWRGPRPIQVKLKTLSNIYIQHTTQTAEYQPKETPLPSPRSPGNARTWERELSPTGRVLHMRNHTREEGGSESSAQEKNWRY